MAGIAVNRGMGIGWIVDQDSTSLQASIAAHLSWAQTEDRAARTAPARRASEARFERLVDPDGVLTPEERAKRAESLRRAYYRQLALKSVRTRKAKSANSGV